MQIQPGPNAVNEATGINVSLDARDTCTWAAADGIASSTLTCCWMCSSLSCNGMYGELKEVQRMWWPDCRALVGSIENFMCFLLPPSGYLRNVTGKDLPSKFNSSQR